MAYVVAGIWGKELCGALYLIAYVSVCFGAFTTTHLIEWKAMSSVQGLVYWVYQLASMPFRTMRLVLYGGLLLPQLSLHHVQVFESFTRLAG